MTSATGLSSLYRDDKTRPPVAVRTLARCVIVDDHPPMRVRLRELPAIEPRASVCA
jgi:hypothetical protein